MGQKKPSNVGTVVATESFVVEAGVDWVVVANVLADSVTGRLVVFEVVEGEGLYEVRNPAEPAIKITTITITIAVPLPNAFLDDNFLKLVV